MVNPRDWIRFSNIPVKWAPGHSPSGACCSYERRIPASPSGTASAAHTSREAVMTPPASFSFTGCFVGRTETVYVPLGADQKANAMARGRAVGPGYVEGK